MSPLPRALRQAAELARLRPAPGPPTQVHVSVTDRCNLPCVHCAIHRKKTKDLSTEAWLRFFDDLAGWLGEAGVNFAGGEPLIRTDLERPSEIRYFNDKGLKIKTETRPDYQCEGDVCTPKVIKMVDHSRGEASTEMVLEEWQVDRGLTEDLFSVRNLQRGG